MRSRSRRVSRVDRQAHCIELAGLDHIYGAILPKFQPPEEQRVQPTEQRAILTLAMLAAFADGAKADREREEVRRVAESLGGDLNLAGVYQDVLLKRVDMASVAGQLSSPELRQLAFELAVGVCEADGLRNDAETRFLAELGQALGLTQPQMAEPAATADALATVPLDEIVGSTPAAAATAALVPAPATGSSNVTLDGTAEAELDKSILNYAILNGALELLPQSMASMAIIPLQMKMVYRIGKRYGYELDRGHIKDFLATVGVGLTGQYLEEVGRKLIGGLFGSVAGRMVGGLARGATGVAFSFATTYALGQVARRYYAGGRTMNTQLLKDTFTQMLGQAKGLQAQYQPQIEQQARTVDVSRIVQMVRGT
jgi:uncharacterized protein (DUF697 family)/tellurite resistance protein